MKEKNKPEPEIIEQQPIIKEEKIEIKRERKYIALSDVEIIDFIDTYRKLLRMEQSDSEKDLLKEKIESLEREMIRRNKIKIKQ